MTREELLKSAKPILFNTEMVRAILEDRKTVTRRVVKRQHSLLEDDCKHEMGFFDTGDNDWACRKLGCGITNTGKSIYHAPYQVGDILYVRETFCSKYDGEMYFYLADRFSNREQQKLLDYSEVRWKPSIHMPKEAARIFLKVTGVRVERLHEINREDYVKEGITDNFIEHIYTSVMDFMILWDSTIKKQDLDKYGWKANPYVWVIEFEKVVTNI